MKPIIRFHTAPIRLRIRDKRTGHLKMLCCAAPLYSRRPIREARRYDGTNAIRIGHRIRFQRYFAFRLRMRFRCASAKTRRRAP